MKKIFLVMVLFVALFNIELYAQDGPTSLHSRSLGDLAETINNYTGFSFSEAELENLQDKVIQLEDINHTSSFLGNFSVISMDANAYQDIIDYAEENLREEKHLLFYFDFSSNSEEILRFNITIKNNELEADYIAGLQDYISSIMQNYYTVENPNIPDILAYGILAYIRVLTPGEFAPYLDLGVSGNRNDASANSGNESDGVPTISINKATTFVSLGGIPIPLPAQSSVAFGTYDNSYRGMLAKFLLDGSSQEYIPFYWSNPENEHYGKFAGYGHWLDAEQTQIHFYTTPPLDENELNNQIYETGDKVTVVVGYRDETYCDISDNSSTPMFYVMQKRFYTVQWEDISVTDCQEGCPPQFTASHTKKTYGDIEEHLSRIVFAFDENLGEVVEMESSDEQMEYSQIVPCEVDRAVDLTGLGGLTSGQAKVITYENGTSGVLMIWGGQKLFSFIDNSGEYWVFVADPNYGWQPADIEEPNFYEVQNVLVDWVVEVAPIVGYGVFITANIVIGNYAGAAWGISAALAVDVGFASAEAAYVYYNSGDPQAAWTTFGTGVIFAGTGTAIQKAIHAFEKLKLAKEILGVRKYGIKINFIPDEGTIDDIVRMDIDDFFNRCSSEFGLTNIQLDLLTLEMKQSASFSRYLFQYPNKVKSWKGFFPDQAIRTNTTWLQKLSDYLTVSPNKLDEVTDMFAIEKGKNRVTAYLRGLLERKHFDGTVYRGDLASVTPTQAFNNGIPSKGAHDNLIKHLDGGSTNKGDFVSSSKDISIANDFASNNGYVFKVRSRNSKGIDVNETLGDEIDNWFPEQLEVSILGGIDKADIIGAYPKGQLTQANFIPNPNYVP